MGKRKRATKPAPKKKSAKLPTVFDCPYCGHEKSVDCIIEKGSSIGRVKCRTCGVSYECVINKLEEAVDVYANWIDACERANKDPEADASYEPAAKDSDVTREAVTLPATP